MQRQQTAMNVWVHDAIIRCALSEEGQQQSVGRSESNLSTKSSFDGPASSRKATWTWVESMVVAGSAQSLFRAPVGGARTINGQGGKRPSPRGGPQDDKEVLTIKVADADSEHDGKTVDISRRHLAAAPDGRGVLPCNPNVDDNELPEDLTQLTHLHEPAVVDCLRKRYASSGWKMYTSSGPILIAINPCRDVPGLYDEKAMRLYSSRGERLAAGTTNSEGPAPPHVFGSADAAYRGMMRGLDFSRSSSMGEEKKEEEEHTDFVFANQSVLVSGESGAGKTVTTKHMMQYLAALSKKVDPGHPHSVAGGGSSIEQRVLQSNAILEAFGNARTLRNDNSSRFGKFIELRFSDRGRLMGASIDTYLLEKARIVGHTCGERTYHVFYEVLAKGALSPAERKKFFIDDKTPSDFAITTSDGGKDRSMLMHSGYDDHAKMFEELKTAMTTMGFTRQAQMEVFQAVCGLLHLSNLTRKEAFTKTNDGEECVLNQSSASLEPALRLLGVEYEALNAAVTTVAFQVAGDTVKKHLNADQAVRAVQALIKGTYDSIFTLLVDQINSCITADEVSVEGGAFIGLLDIFGFESFAHNSFEQLCINYCNESLQQQFNRFVFKLEQQEYKREGIRWDMIEFEDNQGILDLIEKKGGILSLLDEQCKLGMRCTDRTFVSAVYQKCASTSNRFDANKSQMARGMFAIHHYAGMVEYDTAGFMEKNKDEVPMEASELFSNSTCHFVTAVAAVISSKMSEPPKKQSNKWQAQKSSISRVSVGAQFQKQLQKLRGRIDETHPHYVRCLKPNDRLQPGRFDPDIVVDQLRCGGILEAIRVSRAGFPHRYIFEHFESRFGFLSSALNKSTNQNKAQHRPRKVGRLNLGNRGVATPAKRKVPAFKKPKMDPKKACENLVKVIARWILAEREKAKELEVPAQDDTPEPDSLSPRSFWKNQSPTKPRNGYVEHKPLDTSEAGIQLGTTKVFLLQDTFDAIERVRGQVLASNATKIATAVRRYQARKAYLVVIRAYREAMGRSMGGASPAGDVVESRSQDSTVLGNVDVNLLEIFEKKSEIERANSWAVKTEPKEFEWVSIGHGRFVKKETAEDQENAAVDHFCEDYVDL
ncbi:hypothetical protein ACHAXT_010346 [Thalassiosira profunda]